MALNPARGVDCMGPAQFPSSIGTAPSRKNGRPGRVVAGARIERRLRDREPLLSAGEAFLPEWLRAVLGPRMPESMELDGGRRGILAESPENRRE